MNNSKPLPKCPYCGAQPLIRVHTKDDVICNHCSESLLKKVDSWSGKKYVKCPICGYEGPETVSPGPQSRCPKCNSLLLRHE
ncbi:MAG: hypothetical protein ACOC5T_10040 [Elusimicrobiota bacterium]